MTTQALVEIEGVVKRFGSFTALAGVTLNIARGELFCLLGGSGCGKTTLLRCLAGFEQPTEGRIAIDGADMVGVQPYDRPVNMMFQSYALFPHMTTEANVAFGLKQDGVPAAERQRRVAEVLDLVQMGDFMKRKPHQLSGGQRQRVALARALVKRPKLLLLDEPLAALDKKLREQTQFELTRIQREVGVTFVVVTHDQQEAMSLATRIAVMDKGRIVQVGPPSEIYERPQSRFTADFIGSVNLFEGQASQGDGGRVAVAVEGLAEPLLATAAWQPTAGQSVGLAVRPEKITLSVDGSGLGENQLPGVIEDFAYLGDSSLYLITLPSGRKLKVSMPNRAAGGQPLARGTAVTLAWPATVGVLLEG